MWEAGVKETPRYGRIACNGGIHVRGTLWQNRGFMKLVQDTFCSRCRARIPDAGPQRLCSPCVAELMKSDHRETAQTFTPGDRVQIIQGVFAGQSAEVVAVEEDGVVRARSVIMNIPLEVEYLPWQLSLDGRR